MHRVFQSIAAAVALVTLPAVCSASPLKVHWRDLHSDGPPSTGGMESAAGSGSSQAATLQGKTIELSGYMLPADRDGDLVYAFLLMPVAGGCIHMPPPPPDQLILVTSRTPFKAREIYQPVTVTGVLEIDVEKTQLFMLDGTTVVNSGYSLSSAVVQETDRVIDAQPSRGNPWSRLGSPGGSGAPL